MTLSRVKSSDLQRLGLKGHELSHVMMEVLIIWNWDTKTPRFSPIFRSLWYHLWHGFRKTLAKTDGIFGSKGHFWYKKPPPHQLLAPEHQCHLLQELGSQRVETAGNPALDVLDVTSFNRERIRLLFIIFFGEKHTHKTGTRGAKRQKYGIV